MNGPLRRGAQALSALGRRAVDSARREADRWQLGAAALALAACFLKPGVEVEQSLFEHVIVLDVTQSMNVQDEFVQGRPASRLAFAKHALGQALDDLPCGSKVGWAIFTEYRAFLLIAPIEVCGGLVELQSTLARIDGQMAWSGNSEVAKGLHSAWGIARALPHQPSLVFVTDGHEAPPLNPKHRPSFDDKPGDVAGLIVGVGGLVPMPIPKTDPSGRSLGFWGSDEVAQSDVYSEGRGASVRSEKFVDDDAPAPALPGATPGSEHLSSMREAYLRLLAREQRLGFHRLTGEEGLAKALTAPSLARPVNARADLRPLLAGLALCLLLARHLQLPARRLRPLLTKRLGALRWRQSREPELKLRRDT
ncbi:MxaL protein [Ideonella sp. YS5]|uniref:MxaL protein n=1 Tax=Ideonella sp. YS5 TaxID=3453714 RepID=UPI003EEB45BC